MTFQLPAGPVIQLAWVTDDLAVCEQTISSVFGPVRWTRMPDIRFGPETCELHGAPADFVADISLGYAGDLQLEVIRPVSGDSIYTEFLALQGPGQHHVCVETDDIDAVVASARAADIDVPMRGSMGIMDFAYLDLRAQGFGFAEIAQLSDTARDLYASLKKGTS